MSSLKVAEVERRDISRVWRDMSVSKTAKMEKRNIKSVVLSKIDSERRMLIILDRKTGAKTVYLAEDAGNRIKSTPMTKALHTCFPAKTPGSASKE